MQEKILKDIVLNIAGKQASDIVNILIGKRNINEFLIAKKLGLTINQVRNILYKLSENGLVSFTRKKDKRKGWYTYFWTLENEKSFLFMKKQLTKEIENLLSQLKTRENKRFYTCKTCTRELSEENALLTDFTCQECGQVYELSDGDKKVKEFNSKTESLKKQLNIVDEELRKLDEEKTKKRARKNKARPKKKRKKLASKRKTKKLSKRKAKKKKRR